MIINGRWGAGHNTMEREQEHEDVRDDGAEEYGGERKTAYGEGDEEEKKDR
jgi:hypothetical protein